LNGVKLPNPLYGGAPGAQVETIGATTLQRQKREASLEKKR